MELKLKKITGPGPLLEETDRIFHENFPSRTKLSSDAFLALAGKGLLDHRAILDGESVIGFYNVLLSEAIAYLFFFAIDRSLHSRGYGSQALRQIRQEYPDQILILDMEEVDPKAENYAQRCRRRSFYARNGLQDSGLVVSYYGGTFTILSDGACPMTELQELLSNVDLPDFTPVILPAGPTVLESERLVLRPWEERDAEDLYALASNPHIGPRAGWPVHGSVSHSRAVIREALSSRETYAVVRKEDAGDHPVGSVGIKFYGSSDLTTSPREAELGCWIGEAYWGHGLIPEALQVLIRRCFQELGIRRIWYGYYDGNDASRRVAEKCGFVPHHVLPDAAVPLLKTKRTIHTLVLDRPE